MLLLSVAALAQEEITPKADVFVGYQWLDPGGSVPIAGTNPVQSQNVGRHAEGCWLCLRLQLHEELALEADAGVNSAK